MGRSSTRTSSEKSSRFPGRRGARSRTSSALNGGACGAQYLSTGAGEVPEPLLEEAPGDSGPLCERHSAGMLGLKKLPERTRVLREKHQQRQGQEIAGACEPRVRRLRRGRAHPAEQPPPEQPGLLPTEHLPGSVAAL